MATFPYMSYQINAMPPFALGGQLYPMMNIPPSLALAQQNAGNLPGGPQQPTTLQPQGIAGTTSTSPPPAQQTYQKQYPPGASSGEEKISSAARSITGGQTPGQFLTGSLGLLGSGGLNTLGDLISIGLAKQLAPDVSKSTTEITSNLKDVLSQLNEWFQYNPLGDKGLAAAIRAQRAYQRNLLTPDVINNLARAQQSAAMLESLGASTAGRAIGEMQQDRRAILQAMLRSGANPAQIAGALQSLSAQQGNRGREIINAALQQAMEGIARGQSLRDQALQNLAQQQQVSYATRVVPTLNQFDRSGLLQAALAPVTAAESRSQNYIIPSNLFAPLARQWGNQVQMANMYQIINNLKEKGYWDVLPLFTQNTQQNTQP